MPRVFNRRRRYPREAVYIGRGSKWGNPFRIGQSGTREEVIEEYRWYIAGRVARGEISFEELRGKDLVCYCAPLPCHGDYLLQVANG